MGSEMCIRDSAKQVRVKTGADMTDLTHVYVAKRDVSTIPDEGSDN